MLNPEADAQPAGKLPEIPPLATSAEREIGPKIPSAVRPLFAWNAFTAALVKLPK